jgi:hypothetical protein
MEQMNEPKLSTDISGMTESFFLSLGIPLKIILDINIQGKSEKIPLTSSLLYIPPEEPSSSIFTILDTSVNKVNEIIPDVPLDTYPRIPIRQVRLPMERLNQLKYKEIVQFFFNKKIFAKKMEKWTREYGLNTGKTWLEIERKDYPRPHYLLSEKEVENIQIEKENIELMLHLLFPTYSFHTEGYKTSIQYWNSAEPYLTNRFPKTWFSYIRYNGVIYTITNAIWLNDVFNVPFHRELIKYYEYYKDWKMEQIYHLKSLLEKMEKRKEKTIRDEKEVESIKKEMGVLKRILVLLQKKIMDKKEFEDLFQKTSEYSDMYKKYLKHTLSTITKNQLYFYTMIFSRENDRILSYSNERLNEMIYDNISYPLSEEKSITDKELLSILLENMLNYASHKGDIRYLTQDICQKEGGYIDCHGRKELSTFYYTGILYNSSPQNDEPLYEIYVLMDVIEGEVNRKNKARIKCQYENQSIGKKLEFLMGQWPAWDLSNRRIFMKLDDVKEGATDGNPIISKSIIDETHISSIRSSDMDKGKDILLSQLKTRISQWIDFDNQQTEHKLKNALQTMKDTMERFPEKNMPYMEKVKSLDWSLDSNDTELFLNWISNPNKYPSPLEKETNDKYTAMDKKIVSLLEKIETILQRRFVDVSSQKMELENVMEQLNETKSILSNFLETNRSKNIPRLNYIGSIMSFYVQFLEFLETYIGYVSATK